MNQMSYGAIDQVPGSPRIEVLIPAFNEAAHIAESVENARVVGPVVVLDSCSTDGTQEIARRAGARVVEHPWEGYARQKNWGLDNLGFTADWIFILDADERVSPQLADELRRVAASGTPTSGFFVNRVVLFMGRAIRHGGLYPSWNLRFFRRGSCRYEDRAVHEHMVCQGSTDYLRGEMLHIRRESISEYVGKHIGYADLESDEWIRARFGAGGGAEPQRMFKNYLRWRQWVRRNLWPRLPGRPLMRFVYMYLVRLGFLDGVPGFHLACLMANYEYMIGMLLRDKMHRIASGQVIAGLPAELIRRPSPGQS